MRAGFESYFLAISLAVVPLASAAVDTITVDFENAISVHSLLGVENPGTPGAKNIGFDGFYWAWNGQGVVNPGDPASTGFLLGNKKSNPDFSYVGGSDPQFVYLSARLSNAYITTDNQSFDFLGGVFSSTTLGTLSIVGQRQAHGNGNGEGAYTDVDDANGIVKFELKPDPQDPLMTTIPPVTFVSTDFRHIDRRVISSIDANGNSASFQ